MDSHMHVQTYEQSENILHPPIYGGVYSTSTFIQESLVIFVFCYHAICNMIITTKTHTEIFLKDK